jgi:hypothetical protein
MSKYTRENVTLLEKVGGDSLQQQVSGVILHEQMVCLHCVSYTSK